jgi:hypothetical protein
MTRAQILLLAALVLAPLFSLLWRAVMRRLEGDRSRDLESGAQSRPALVLSPPAPAAAPAVHTRATPRSSGTGIGVETRAVPGHWGSHGEMRRGLVLMAILGPCRALDPPV